MPIETEDYRLLHFVMCDDVRLEAFTNKAMFIGVWNRLVVTRAAPWTARQIRFVFALRGPAPSDASAPLPDKSFEFNLRGPADFLIGPLTGEVEQTPSGLTSVFVGLDDVVFPAGVYTASLLIDDRTFAEQFEVQVNAPLLAEIKASTQAWPRKKPSELPDPADPDPAASEGS